jgi:hypothetical protein
MIWFYFFIFNRSLDILNINQSMNQSINQSINQSMNQSMNQNKIIIRPSELQSIIEWAWQNPRPDDSESMNDILNNACDLFMEDVSQYEDKILINVEYKSYRYRFLCTQEEYDTLIEFKGNLNFSKNINNLKWDDVHESKLDDPYDIARIYNPASDKFPKWAFDILNLKLTSLDIIRETSETKESPRVN